ncbi:e3 ubiquitin-protein ligase DCST1 [Nephila pilipes]|uniref:E3 ubiquitin-protein ligase DCST1 n=1 Tax=Nephila pilipes TaxID=299642 RepID=A0A8X6UBV6_NEPPI|nr:e3 ubiquitin-protein ligase DCST1 [Nephila pilipes]
MTTNLLNTILLFPIEETSPSEESTIIDIPDEEEKLIPEIDYQAARAKRYRKRNRAIGKCFQLFCPCLAILLYSKRNQYRAIKAMLGFPIGALFGYALHKLVLERFQLSPFANQCLCSILVLCMGIGYALSTQIRCICFLTIAILCGKTGRMYLSTFIITSVIFGPIANITFNARESMRVMSCITSLNLNHTVERFKLMFQPIKEIVMDFVGAGDKIQEKTKQIEKPYNQIDKEVRDEEDVKEDISETELLDKELKKDSRVDLIKKKFSGVKKKFGSESESKYGMKSEFRCEGIFTKGVKACYRSFSSAYDRCYNYLPIIGYLLCWPMKLTFICDLASSFMGRRTCDSNVAMTPGFGEGMDTADAVQKEFDKQFGVSMQYKLEIPPDKIDQITPSDISASIQHQFERRKRILDFFLNVVNRLLALTFLHVFNASRKYCERYLKVIEYDNKYITPYFRHIDARRHRQGKKTLLPLKKSEKIELMEPLKIKYSREEKHAMVFNTLRLVGELTTVSILLGFDWIFYEFLMLIQRHAQVTYHQTGAHHIKMTIYGDGFVGNMVRSIMKGFDKKHSVDEVTSTAACLPQPTKLLTTSIYTIYALFLLIFILALFQSYFMRLRRAICSFFYPKREKKRILFLYNDRLKKRKSYLKYMRHRIRKKARGQAIELESGVFFSLRHMYPKYFGWLGSCGLGKRKCLVCEEVESWKVRFTICSEECPFSYCPECWKEIKGMCYVCSPDDDDDSPPSEDDLDDDKED